MNSSTISESLPHSYRQIVRCCRRDRHRLAVAASDPEKQLFGEDFGARDPTAGELESGFASKVLGNANTEHQIKPPEAMSNIMGLKTRKCVPCEQGGEPLPSKEVDLLCNQVPGWKVIKDSEGRDRIRTEWKVKSFVHGLECFKRIAEVAEEQNHHPDLHLENWNTVRLELWTHSVGGLTENDFIMAAKINDIDISDLKRKTKPKMWA
ncbi:unnamed protein product [Ostreobium quekettii]|uniref:4a-hydroxytetrahydrobiopterin dehydratase n=1 Tax=Ostreobium quekettii TaxID=121088 RepID=A0A8S1JDB3_9CHLO|nr:unnamed protein product [Ostreobium quekettii]